MALARIFALHLPFYDAKFTSKVEYQQPLGSLKIGIAKQINQIISFEDIRKCLPLTDDDLKKAFAKLFA